MTHRRRFFAYATGRVFAVAVLAVFGILSMPGHAAAQSQVGTLVGNVKDESGGAIPGATVTANPKKFLYSPPVTSSPGRTALRLEPPDRIFGIKLEVCDLPEASEL